MERNKVGIRVYNNSEIDNQWGLNSIIRYDLIFINNILLIERWINKKKFGIYIRLRKND